MIQQGKIKLQDYVYMLGLPHQSELVNFYEDYFAGKYSSCQKLNKS
jgi:hypothetical protein